MSSMVFPFFSFFAPLQHPLCSMGIASARIGTSHFHISTMRAASPQVRPGDGVPHWRGVYGSRGACLVHPCLQVV